ncbi:MAG: alpha/beta hydrolase [Nocardioides sp.]
MLFPEARAALDLASDDLSVASPDFDVVAARRQARALAATLPREEVASVEDVDADGVPCRIYLPEDAVRGTVVHLHGGGFVLNDVEVHDASARRLANRTRRAVISVDYRLAPEHRFPAAPDDVDTVLSWIEGEGAVHGLEGPLLGHGDSAGANLVLVAALRHPGLFDALALTYPFLDPTAGYASHESETEGFDAREVAWYWEQYAGGDVTRYDDPDLAPLRSERLATLPPTLVTTAEHDPLRDEGEHLARLLAEQGVEVVAARYLGQVHGFWRHDSVFSAAEPLMRQVASFLVAHG